MNASVIVATYNRSTHLRQCLESLSTLEMAGDWEVLVVDNNSNDDTPAVVAAAARTFPTQLRYLFEGEQGMCAALNAGLRASRGCVVALTDDDVRVHPRWLDAAVQALDDPRYQYTGGRVLPLWDAPAPPWVVGLPTRLHGVLGILNYGDEPVEFGQRYVPLTSSLACRAEVFARVGLFDTRIGRKAGTLLGQEAREWGMRVRAAGLRGVYAPNMISHHVIPRDRLTRWYFRRWFYWHGISRALLYAHHRLNLEAPEDTSLDPAHVPHVARVPRYLFRTLLRKVAAMVVAHARRRGPAAFEHELWLWFFLGIVVQRWRDGDA